jgi:hypothetical protein
MTIVGRSACISGMIKSGRDCCRKHANTVNNMARKYKPMSGVIILLVSNFFTRGTQAIAPFTRCSDRRVSRLQRERPRKTQHGAAPPRCTMMLDDDACHVRPASDAMISALITLLFTRNLVPSSTTMEPCFWLLCGRFFQPITCASVRRPPQHLRVATQTFPAQARFSGLWLTPQF